MANELCVDCNKREGERCTVFNREGVSLHNSRGYCIVGRQYSADYAARHKPTISNRRARVGQGKTKQGGNL